MRSVLPLATLVLLALPSPARAADDRAITTQGEAVVYVVPDEVHFTFGLRGMGATPEEARQKLAAASARLISTAKAHGVRDADMRTDWANIAAKYPLDDPARPLEGYLAERSYSIVLRDVSRFEALLEAAVKAGSNWFVTHEFRTSELRKHRDQARRNALHAARDKAAALAAEAGCRLGAPRTIQDGYGGSWYYSGWSRWGRYQPQSQNVSFQAEPTFRGGEDPLPVGRIAVSASVTASFDLIPALAAR